MYDLDRAEYHLYSDRKIMKLLQTLMELWHYQIFRGKKPQIITI